MRVSVDLQGAKELAALLDRVPLDLTFEMKRDALVAGAEFIRREAETLAPRRPGAGQHLADRIIIDARSESEIANSEDAFASDAVVDIGPEKDAFYGYFHEFGTSVHGAQPFMRPAFDTQVETAKSVAFTRLWQFVRKALRL